MEKSKRSRKTMWYVLILLLILFTAIIVFFRLPFSKTKTEFNKAVENKIVSLTKSSEVFTEEDIEGLPESVQKYLRRCGYIGTTKMNYMKATFQNVDFKMSAEKTISIDYTQYNFVNKPDRFALIDSNLYGIPFEGFDSYNDGVGSMKGNIAKLITLFDQRGEEMDKACLVTYLAESLMVPSATLKDFIVWEEIDKTNAKATINYYGISASGIFTFNEDGLWLSFKTSDRVATSMDGTKREAEWSAIIQDYQDVNGLLLPRVVKSIWHYPEGDFVYFNENDTHVSFEFY
jgi:hypothetical protein